MFSSEAVAVVGIYVYAALMYCEPLYYTLDSGEVKWMLATSMEMVSNTEWIFHSK